MSQKTNILLTAATLAVLLPLIGFGAGAGPAEGTAAALFAAGRPFEQTVVLTAYYSPEPDQCCYVRGSYAADVALNGQGVAGADGTAVYPGMIAAPPSYPFGTRIDLPGLGTLTVHDRGGAIQEWKDSHRIDIWVGSGEEGLARAIAFGVRTLHAIVYPPTSAQPKESFDTAVLPAPPDRIRPFLAANTTLLDLKASAGDRTASVQFLQERLKTLGYFRDAASGFYGPMTQKSLLAFYSDMGIKSDATKLTHTGAAIIEAAFQRKDAAEPVKDLVNEGSAPARIAEAQRTLHFLGYYTGRMNGEYSDAFRDAVVAFQKDQKLIKSPTSAGAGNVGPATRKRVVGLWRAKLAVQKGKSLMDSERVEQLLEERGYDFTTYLKKGQHGDDVVRLQNFLVERGYLKTGSASGKFGSETEQAIVAYQKAEAIIVSDKDAGAGFVGPATLVHFHQDMREQIMKTVRSKGWDAI